MYYNVFLGDGQILVSDNETFKIMNDFKVALGANFMKRRELFWHHFWGGGVFFLTGFFNLRFTQKSRKKGKESKKIDKIDKIKKNIKKSKQKIARPSGAFFF